jgi:hypothetical protein
VAITFVSAGESAAGTGNVTPGLPSGWAENDIFVLFVETSPGEVPPTPSGWISKYDLTRASYSKLTVFWRRATSSESAPTITDPGNHALAIIVAFRGCVKGEDPWGSTSEYLNVSAASVTWPAITTTVNSCMVLNLVSSGSVRTQADWANASLTGLAERVDVSTTEGGNGSLAMASGILATAGSSGGTNATANTTSYRRLSTVYLRPYIEAISVASGSFAVSGSAATLTKSSLVGSSSGSFVITGAAATLAYTPAGRLEVGSGSFTITGTEAEFARSYVLGCDPGSFDINVTEAGLFPTWLFSAGAGACSITGGGAGFVHTKVLLSIDNAYHGVTFGNVTLRRDRAFMANAGEFALTGTPTGFLRSLLLSASPGSFTFIGSATGLFRSSALVSCSGTFTITGAGTGLTKNYAVDCNHGAFTLTGTAVNFVSSHVLDVGPGSFSVSGTAAELWLLRLLSGGSETFTVTGSEASFTYTKLILAIHDAYHRVTFDNVNLAHLSVLSPYPGQFVVTGTPAIFLRSFVLAASRGQFTLTGGNVAFFLARCLSIHDAYHEVTMDNIVDMLVDRILSSGPGVIAVTGAEADCLLGRLLAASPASFVLTGSKVAFTIELTLTIHDANHQVTMAVPVLVVPGSYTLVIDDCLHEITMDGAAIVMPVSLDIHDALHAITMDNVVIPLPVTLDIHDAIHAMTMQHVDLNGFNYSNVTIKINIGGTWKPVSGMKLMIDEAWKAVTGVTLRQ